MTDAPPTTGSRRLTDGRPARESSEALPARLGVTATESDSPGAPGDYAPSGVTEERPALVDPPEENP